MKPKFDVGGVPPGPTPVPLSRRARSRSPSRQGRTLGCVLSFDLGQTTTLRRRRLRDSGRGGRGAVDGGQGLTVPRVRIVGFSLYTCVKSTAATTRCAHSRVRVCACVVCVYYSKDEYYILAA